MKKAVPAARQGKLIVFEGVSGTGKETQAKLLQTYLSSRHITSHIVFHPRPELKPLLKKAPSVREQLALLVRDRHDVVTNIISPALDRGEWVISLRNYVSAYVYQGNGSAVKRIDVKPDYVFYFDIDPKQAMARVVKRNETRGMYETLKLLQEKRTKYKEIFSHIPHITLNAGLSIDEIHRNVIKSMV